MHPSTGDIAKAGLHFKLQLVGTKVPTASAFAHAVQMRDQGFDIAFVLRKTAWT